jgi:acetyl esterase/lipase
MLVAMKRAALVFSISALLARGDGQKEMPLWPGEAPGSEGSANQEVTERGDDGERRTRLVVKPAITVHLPTPAIATGTAVVIAPGGGFRHLAIDKEGHDVARWLNTLGVAGIVLKYRVSPPGADPAVARKQVTAWALADAKQAMNLVRGHAAEWGIRPERVGFMGFSAGAFLATSLGLHFDGPTRPAFLGIIYGAVDEGAVFPADTPPAFLVHADDDPTVPAARSTAIFEALKRAKVPAELHIYSKGGHGFGIRKKGLPVDAWPDRMKEWLQLNGWLAR